MAPFPRVYMDYGALVLLGDPRVVSAHPSSRLDTPSHSGSEGYSSGCDSTGPSVDSRPSGHRVRFDDSAVTSTPSIYRARYAHERPTGCSPSTVSEATRHQPAAGSGSRPGLSEATPSTVGERTPVARAFHPPILTTSADQVRGHVVVSTCGNVSGSARIEVSPHTSASWEVARDLAADEASEMATREVARRGANAMVNKTKSVRRDKNGAEFVVISGLAASVRPQR